MENHEYKRFEAHAMRGGGWALFGVDYLNGLHFVADINSDWMGYSCRVEGKSYSADTPTSLRRKVEAGLKAA